MIDFHYLLISLLKELRTRKGSLVIKQAGEPRAVILSITKYNELQRASNLKIQHSSMSTKIELSPKACVLVTGGAGYIGGHVVHTLARNGLIPIVVDDFRKGKKEHIPAGVKVYEGNISNFELLTRIFAENSIEAVIHLAALLEVEESVSKPLEYLENNAAGTYVLLQAMEQAKCKKIIFSSTAAVYGEQEIIPIPESAPLKPNNPYGESKLIAEKILEYFADYLGFSVTVLRYFNVAGCEPEYWVSDTHYNSHLIPMVLEVALNKRDTFTINGQDYATFDGTCVRDFIHVSDVALAHLAALKTTHMGLEVYNIGTGKGFSVEEVIQAAAEITGKMIPIEIGPRRPGDAAITVANVQKIYNTLGFTPKYSSLEHILTTSWQMAKRAHHDAII